MLEPAKAKADSKFQDMNYEKTAPRFGKGINPNIQSSQISAEITQPLKLTEERPAIG